MSVEHQPTEDSSKRHPLMRIFVPDFLFLSDGTTLQPDAIEKSLRKEGRLYESPCAEIIKKFFVHFSRQPSKREYVDELNLANHLSQCQKRTCLMGLDTKMYIWTIYEEPTREDFDGLKAKVRDFFAWDRAEEVIVGETLEWLTEQENQSPQYCELISIARRELKKGIGSIGNGANLKLSLDLFAKFWVPSGHFVLNPLDMSEFELRRKIGSEEKIALIITRKNEFKVYRESLFVEARKWFDRFMRRKSNESSVSP